MSRYRTRMDAVRAGAEERTPPRGPNGRYMCWQCRTVEVPPRRQVYCSNECADEYGIRNYPSFARAKVFERDHGLCALCGVTTSSWEADHILPVIEGGGHCGLDNLRTLCVPCHRQVTRELRARIAGSGPADPHLQPALFESVA
jgi:5-methylcytosine-specific restriction enzyme A